MYIHRIQPIPFLASSYADLVNASATCFPAEIVHSVEHEPLFPRFCIRGTAPACKSEGLRNGNMGRAGKNGEGDGLRG